MKTTVWGAADCEKGDVKCFPKVLPAVGQNSSCHAALPSKGNFQKTCCKTFFTTCRPRLYTEGRVGVLVYEKFGFRAPLAENDLEVLALDDGDREARDGLVEADGEEYLRPLCRLRRLDVPLEVGVEVELARGEVEAVHPEEGLPDDAVLPVHVDVVHEQAERARVDRQRGRLKQGTDLIYLRLPSSGRFWGESDGFRLSKEDGFSALNVLEGFFGLHFGHLGLQKLFD